MKAFSTTLSILTISIMMLNITALLTMTFSITILRIVAIDGYAEHWLF
jgi:hypothetical protein